jgi:hypothetical protein
MTNTLPLYTSHKTVSAARIERVTDAHALQGGGAMLKLAGIEHPRHVSAEFVEKHDPVAGGYFVVYADGYQSFSPAAAFEGGYSPAEATEGMSAHEVLKAIVLPKLKAAQDLAVLHGMPVVSVVGVSPGNEVGMATLCPGQRPPPIVTSVANLLQMMQTAPDAGWRIMELISMQPVPSEHAPKAMH